MPARDVSDAWRARSVQWLAWARTAGHDVYFAELNLPWFAELLPSAGRRTLDIGCGEGRLGRWLSARGHSVCGIDSAPLLIDAARAAGGYDQLVCADASAPLPWADASFDLAVAFMSWPDMSDPRPGIAELGRVLEPGGVLCAAMVHPLNRPPEAVEAYFLESRCQDVHERDGLTMVFESIERPLSYYTEALTDAGFVIERLREPRASVPTSARLPQLQRATTFPFFVHLRCRLAG